MIIVGCLNVFECDRTIDRTLKSIELFVDRIIAVDGAYEGFSDHVRSQDDTILKIQNFPKSCILIGNSTSNPFKSEMKKRNAYLLHQFYSRDAWVFIIDGDEYILSSVEETIRLLQDTKEDWFAVKMTDPNAPENPAYLRDKGFRTRLIRYRKGMKYVGNHYTIQYPDGRTVPIKDAPLSPLVVAHDDSHVSEEYRRAMMRYNREIRPKVEVIKECQ